MIAAAGLAFVSGALVVLSPCTLPVLPGLLAVVGRPHASQRASWWAGVGPVALFAVSVAFGLAGVTFVASALAGGFLLWRPPWSLLPAGMLLLAGLFTFGLGSSKSPSFVHQAAARGGRFVPILTGLALGAAWTPCATPSLGLGLLAVSNVDSLALGLVVLAAYVLGVVAPLACVLLGVLRVPRVRRGVQRSGNALQRISGAILVACAVLVATGEMNTIVTWTAQALI